MAGGAAADTPDAVLVRQALAGEREAFTCLITRHKLWLFRFIRRFTGNDDDAFDVLQDCLVAAWLGLKSYDPERPFNGWIRQVALNKCRDWSRRRALRNVVSLFGNLDVFAADSRGSSPEGELVTGQALDCLDRAIASLPRALREPLILTAFEGLSHREAAELLGISGKAVETRIYRARHRLAEAIQESSPDSMIEDLPR